MITEKDLRSGIYLKAKKARGYKEFILWRTDGGVWFKFVVGHGQVAGYYMTDRILKYLNRYNFEIVGYYKLDPIMVEAQKVELENFLMRGAL